MSCFLKECDARSHLHKVFKFGRQWVQNRLTGVTDRVKNFIFVSPFSQRILEKHLPAAGRFFVLPNPIDIPKRAPIDVENNSYWLFVGRLAPDKGSQIFAHAAARLDLDAVFVGDGEDFDAIRKIHPKARMLGWLEQESVVSALENARGLVFPSRALESSPLVVREAQALGLPVIAASETAAVEQLIDGETGLIFRKNDVSDLAAKISRLQNDPGLRVQMGRRAFEWYWSEPTTLQKHLEGLLDIYRAIE